MISLGQGGYSPSLQAFGADQLENGQDDLPDDESRGGSCSGRSKFFQWWYFGICCGSLLGVSVMSYVQDNLGWGIGFAIPTLSMLGTIVFFLCGNRLYLWRRTEIANGGSSFEGLVQAVKVAMSRVVEGGSGMQKEYAIVELELQEKTALCGRNSSDDTPVGPHNATPLEAAKAVLRLIPIWTTLLPFAVVFQQPATFFTKQGTAMRRRLGGTRFEISPAALQSAITTTILLLMPLYDRCFVPLARALTRNERGVSVTQRMGIGMTLSVAAMAAAAATEGKRQRSVSSPLSIFRLLPQYVLLGVSDVFMVVGMQEFFYSKVPPGMRAVGIALCTSVFGVGSYLSAALISVIEWVTGRDGDWFSDDMAKARLDKYYWFLAALSSVSLAGFVGCCSFFRGRT